MIDVGKYAKVISKTAHTHRGHIGRVVGYTNNNRYVVLYFSDTRVKAQFEPGSITLLN